jgi:hypothetical protein
MLGKTDECLDIYHALEHVSACGRNKNFVHRFSQVCYVFHKSVSICEICGYNFTYQKRPICGG